MGLKEFLKNALFGLLGIVVLSELFNLIGSALFLSYFSVVKPVAFPNIKVFLGISSWIVLMAGFLAGYISRAKRNVLYYTFVPDKYKISFSFALSLCLVSMSYLIHIITKKNLIVLSTTLQPVSSAYLYALAILSYAILFYPFSALAGFIYKFRKNKKYHANKIKIVLLLILLNPIFVALSSSVAATIRVSASTEPCGVLIVGFTELSPAKNAGMQLGETITQIDGVSVNSLNDITGYLSNISNPKEVSIKTKRTEYTLTLVKGANETHPVLGVKLNQEYCKR